MHKKSRRVNKRQRRERRRSRKGGRRLRLKMKGGLNPHNSQQIDRPEINMRQRYSMMHSMMHSIIYMHFYYIIDMCL